MAASIPKAILRTDRDKPVRAGHPWIFSGALREVTGAKPGDTVDIVTSRDEFIGRGYYNPSSQIAVRLWSLGDHEINADYFRGKLEAAIARRRQMGLVFKRADAETSAFRLVNAESDFLPGLVVDAYNDTLAVQLLTLGIERHRHIFLDLLEDLLEPAAIYERDDVRVREKEGLEMTTGLLRGSEPPATMVIKENGISFPVDVRSGQKTGFYLDQRENRACVGRLAATLAPAGEGAETVSILNAFSYTGGFGVYAGAALAGARIVNVDSSNEALKMAKDAYQMNNVNCDTEYICGNVFQVLREFRDNRSSFDMIILDPPKFAHSQDQIQSACRGYKDLNLLAFKLLRPNGYLATFSCSGLLSPELFQKVIFSASHDAQRQIQVIGKLSHAHDHPFSLAFPEGEYLKGMVLRS